MFLHRIVSLLVLTAVATALTLAPAASSAQAPVVLAPPAAAALSWGELRGGLSPVPSLVSPHRMPIGPEGPIDAFWGPDGLWPRPFALPRAEGPVPARGPAAWDPSSSAFFASLAGLLVRIDRPEGAAAERLVALIDGVQGHDLDVRAAVGLAVSREPDDTIVLHRFAGGLPGRRVLLSGPSYFEPRLSPDGTQVLVSQSHPEGGRMVLVQLQPAQGEPAVRDLGQGYGPNWHPAGDRVIFARVQDRSQRIAAAELWMHQLSDGRQQAITATADIAEIEPAISPDGHFVAYTDALTQQLCVASLPPQSKGGAR